MLLILLLDRDTCNSCITDTVLVYNGPRWLTSLGYQAHLEYKPSVSSEDVVSPRTGNIVDSQQSRFESLTQRYNL